MGLRPDRPAVTGPGLARLAGYAAELARTADGRPEGTRAEALAERLGEGRFLVSVVGEFKRGKSTLVNALVGDAVVPAGVLPLTAVRTELRFGRPSTAVEHLDGTSRQIEREAVRDYVAEELNPGNEKKVARVVMTGEWGLLAGGVVLVDTPGVGSIYEHNSAEARAALLESDGAIIVLAADAPLSAAERDMLNVLRDRQAPVFFVLNKADRLAPGELAEVRAFLARVIEDHLGRTERIFEVDARTAMSCRLAGEPAGSGFDELLDELARFVRDDLVGALERSARRELAGLGCSLGESLLVERSALDMDRAGAARAAAAFERAAAGQRRAFEDDRTLLRRDCSQLGRDLRARLDDFAARRGAQLTAGLEQTVAGVPAHRARQALWEAIQQIVEEAFDAFRAEETVRVEAEWREVAERFRQRTQERIGSVRQIAADLFRIELADAEIPAVEAETERFFYLFLRVGSSSDLIASAVSRLLPVSVVKARALRRARVELGREFVKHAGRAGWDLEQRLGEAARKLERAMGAELDECIAAIAEAARRAEIRRTAIEKERTAHEAGTVVLSRLAEELSGL